LRRTLPLLPEALHRWFLLAKVRMRIKTLNAYEVHLVKRRFRVKKRTAKILSVILLAFLARIPGVRSQHGQLEDVPDREIGQTVFATLPLEKEKRATVEMAVKSHNYRQAEEILVGEVGHQPNSYVLLTFLGKVFFLDGKYLDCAVAMKKADKVTPLKDSDRITLALSYLSLNHPDWARPELETLTRSDPGNPFSTYWLGRIDYDAMQFKSAAAEFQKVLELNPNFMKAYDNLGLTYEALGQYDDAIKTYTQGNELNRKHAVPSPWPPLNLGTLLVKLEKFEEAEANIRESLLYDSRFPKAHLQLGLVLAKQKKDADALRELRQAIKYDPMYAEPHYVLGRIYQRRGDRQQADLEWETFQRLKADQPRVIPH
jgi:tetratricopeptide (TPR) repeat protein